MRTENGSLNNDNVNDDEPVYEELDRIITDDEILVAISNYVSLLSFINPF
jgi:hypothetical protein